MTDDSALHHLVDPGEHLCTWVFEGALKTSNVRVPGSITLEGSQAPQGHGYGYSASEIPRVLDDTPALTSFPRRWTLPALRADLATGTSVMLLNVTVSVWAPERVRITAAAALAGRSFPLTNLAAVCDVDVQVTRLDVIAATAPLQREIRFPRDDGMVLYGVAPGQRAEIVWEDASANLMMSYVSEAAPADLYRHYHVFSPLLKIELDEPLAFLEFSTVWLDPIRNLTSVATSAAESITWVTATGEAENGDDGTWQVFAAGISQQPYASSEAEIVSTTAALALGRDGDDLLAVLRNWVSLDKGLHPVLHTFGREIRGLSDQSPRGRFLTLMQAIEGAHQREDAGQMAAKQAEHTKQRDAIMSRAVADSWTAKERRFLKDYLAKDRHSASESALRWFAQQVPGDVAAGMAKTTLVKDMLTSAAASTWADALRIIRNDLSHGRRSYSPRDLEQLNAMLLAFLTSLTLKLLGVGVQAQRRAALVR